ncbi:MAG: rod-binding protein [Schwartzia sp.]|nr:rod-binding protein [Schwartzia sp. (in: firmicutes)]
MINGMAGMDSVRSQTRWGAPNMTRETSQAQADAVRFQDALNRATKAMEDAKVSVDASGISAEAESKKLREACEGFEAMFLDIMFKEMRNTVPENTLFGESQGEKVWHSMLDTELMQNVAKAGGVGIANMMYDNLIDQVTAQTLNAQGKIGQ